MGLGLQTTRLSFQVKEFTMTGVERRLPTWELWLALSGQLLVKDSATIMASREADKSGHHC
jgi:hypothetical protein